MSLSFKDNIKLRFANLRQKISPLPAKKPSSHHADVADAKVVLFFNCVSLEEINVIEKFILKYLKTNVLNSTCLVYANFLITENQYNDKIMTIININDFSIFGRIKGELKNWLLNTKFDILISFADSNDIICNKIISLSASHLKVGSYNMANINLFDLTIHHTSSDYHNQLQQTIHYLNKLNINL